MNEFFLSCGHAAPHHAKGLCLSCYHKLWRRARGATPGPNRWSENETRTLKDLARAKKMLPVPLTLKNIAEEMSKKSSIHYTVAMVSGKLARMGFKRRGKK